MLFYSYNATSDFPAGFSKDSHSVTMCIMPTIESSAVDVHVLCRETGRLLYLVLHRSPEKRYAGQWRIVAGKINAGETAPAAATRELFEETGLQPIGVWSLDYTHTYYDPVEDTVKLIPVFAMEVAPLPIQLSDEHDDARWITYEQALEILRCPGQREGLRRTHEDIATRPDRGAAFRIDTHA